MRPMKILAIFFTFGIGLAFAAGDPAAGKAVYDKFCRGCHGETGEGNPKLAKMMKVEFKDLGSAEVQGMKDADLKVVIIEGKGKMKPVKAVSAGDIDNVIAYVRTLKK